MTHSMASLPVVFIVAAAAVPFCSCWVYQKPPRRVGTQAAHTCIPWPAKTTQTFFPCPSPPAHLDHPEQRKPSRIGMVRSTLTCHELAEHSVQTLPFRSALVQR